LTGYYDRVGVFEVLVMSDELKRLVIGKASHKQLLAAAIAGGMVPLRTDAWHKVAAGVTTVSEVLRNVYII
jgi:type II secretory ATPase GspE/PulE/Tfp pilus assembly ATPase PilB-like protein